MRKECSAQDQEAFEQRRARGGRRGGGDGGGDARFAAAAAVGAGAMFAALEGPEGDGDDDDAVVQTTGATMMTAEARQLLLSANGLDAYKARLYKKMDATDAERVRLLPPPTPSTHAQDK